MEGTSPSAIRTRPDDSDDSWLLDEMLRIMYPNPHHNQNSDITPTFYPPPTLEIPSQPNSHLQAYQFPPACNTGTYLYIQNSETNQYPLEEPIAPYGDYGHPTGDCSPWEAYNSPSTSPSANITDAIPPASPQPSTSTKSFFCRDCGKAFDRRVRAQYCENVHRRLKPYACGGKCDDPECTKEYASPDSRRQHIKPGEKHMLCADCSKLMLKKNFARHRRVCKGSPQP